MLVRDHSFEKADPFGADRHVFDFRRRKSTVGADPPHPIFTKWVLFASICTCFHGKRCAAFPVKQMEFPSNEPI
jgi:hypothetical protein